MFEDFHAPEGEALEYRKWKGKHRICHTSYYFGYGDGHDPELQWSITPYPEWSGTQRLEMLQHVPGLFKAAEEQVKAFIENAKDI